MEASGIREEDFFSPTFSDWRQGDHIYSVNYNMNVWGIQMNANVLGSSTPPDIETLVDALLAWTEDNVYSRGMNSRGVLRAFLAGTDTLWGMVDWERGSCDFDTPLFEKLLEASRRYGDDGRRSSPSIVETMRFDSLISFMSVEEQKSEGLVTCGYLFDDGCHATYSSGSQLAINANSLHKEGAWEFICQLLEEETQVHIGTLRIPVNKKAFEVWLQADIEKWTEIKYVNGIKQMPFYYGANTSEEKKSEYRTALDEARPLPRRIQPILDIILDEAESYFNGSKSAEDVANVVNNRVRLYLNEIR